MQGLLKDQLQDVFERLGIGGIVEVPDASKPFRHVFFNAHADHKRLDHNAFGLQSSTHCAGVFIASFNAVGDEDDHIASWGIGEIRRRLLQGPCDWRGPLCPNPTKGLLDDQVVGVAEGHHQFCVVAILLAWHVLGAMSVHPQSQLQLLAVVELFEGLAQQVGGRFNFPTSTPKRIHAVRGVEDKQNARGQIFAFSLDFAAPVPGFVMHTASNMTIEVKALQVGNRGEDMGDRKDQ